MTELIAKIDRSNYKTIITAGNHTFIGDEPAPYG